MNPNLLMEERDRYAKRVRDLEEAITEALDLYDAGKAFGSMTVLTRALKARTR